MLESGWAALCTYWLLVGLLTAMTSLDWVADGRHGRSAWGYGYSYGVNALWKSVLFTNAVRGLLLLSCVCVCALDIEIVYKLASLPFTRVYLCIGQFLLSLSCHRLLDLCLGGRGGKIIWVSLSRYPLCSSILSVHWWTGSVGSLGTFLATVPSARLLNLCICGLERYVPWEFRATIPFDRLLYLCIIVLGGQVSWEFRATVPSAR